jgi:hypothetical protein
MTRYTATPIKIIVSVLNVRPLFLLWLDRRVKRSVLYSPVYNSMRKNIGY